MGLAASQARFLGITARKSNIEYEGQQVNQQRTALAEEVNALYSKLIALEAPIPPDTTAFYKSDYCFNISDKTNNLDGDYRITNYYQNSDGTYHINVTRSYEVIAAKESDLASNGWKIRTKKDADGNDILDANGNPQYEIYKKDRTDKETAYTLSLSSDESNKNMTDLINGTTGVTPVGTEQTFYSYQIDGQFQYIPAELVTGFIDSEDSTSPLRSYHKDKVPKEEKTSYENVDLYFDDNGRINKIDIPGYYTGLSVDTERYHNDEEYEAALRDYTMEKDEYNKMVADLNARTESLQQEDKVLELRLNQIDTEQQQLSTELEAVKNVLKENIESTFKTFS